MTEAVARVKEFGANKYNDGNWRLGNKPDVEYLDSMFRHMDYFFAGEFYDQDSGCPHLAHAVWNLSALAELNYGDKPVMDEKIFCERMAYWAEKKAEKEDKKTRVINEMAKGATVVITEVDKGVSEYDEQNEKGIRKEFEQWLGQRRTHRADAASLGTKIPEGTMPKFITLPPLTARDKEIRASINKLADGIKKGAK
jgi:hypothetical protein